MSMFRRILAPTDFSDTAEAALRYAAGLAQQHGASLRVVHVIEGTRAHGGGRAADHSRETAAAQEWVDRHLPAEARSGVEVEVRVIDGYPAFAIPRHAAQDKFDLIVMGTHGRGDQPHAAWGSVAEKVVSTSACPVLTIRHPRHQKAALERLAAAERA